MYVLRSVADPFNFYLGICDQKYRHRLYIHIITELCVLCVRSTGSTLITLVRIGYAMRSKYVRAQCSYYNTGVKCLKEEKLTKSIEKGYAKCFAKYLKILYSKILIG